MVVVMVVVVLPYWEYAWEAGTRNGLDLATSTTPFAFLTLSTLDVKCQLPCRNLGLIAPLPFRH